jgi:pimeloyl-ACP methyl ester carboxylesterase
MRARYPDLDGCIERDGVKIFYEVFGDGEPTILLLPAWSIVHSRHWKFQVPYLARHHRVITFDGRGNGRSDRPPTAEAYADDEFVADALAVMDATNTGQAVVAGFSKGGGWALQLAATHPERVSGVVFVAPHVPFGEILPERAIIDRFDDVLDTHDEWAKYNRHFWRHDYHSFVEYFMAKIFTEPHSTKQVEDTVSWALETTPEVLALTHDAPGLHDIDQARELAGNVRCPALIIHGHNDAIVSFSRSPALAQALGGVTTLVRLQGAGHAPHVRDPVKVNVLMREFVEAQRTHPTTRARRWTRGKSRRKRALYISSPIGLGHAQRDVAIVDELRKIHPDLEVDWLAQHPVTAVLAARGERIHPASAFLANESQHMESESAEHDLHCFQTWRRMDEILLANFMVFHDIVREDDYDLWIGDEAWELDYYLHENPEEKRAAYCWLTDFVGWLPMADGGVREAHLTADYNAEMIGHIARYPRLRDRAIFVGDPDDIVDDSDPTCPSSASGPRNTLTSPATSRGSIPKCSRTERRTGLSSDTGRTRRCVSSPWAAPESASTCFGAWSTHTRQPSRPSPVYAWSSSPDLASTPQRCPRPMDSRCTPMLTSSTAISPLATSRSCRAG